MLLSSAYFPPVQYFTKLISNEQCHIEQYENYQKQTYRNRCIIDSPNGALSLTIPIEKFPHNKCLMKDVRISEHGDWRHVHWQAFTSSYFNTPFFEYYQDEFRPFFERKFDFLIDFNEEIILKCCELIDIQTILTRTTCYAEPLTNEDDYRGSISPKRNWSDDKTFHPIEYYQVFAHKHGFLPNLSIADLLFNMGPESLVILHKSIAANLYSSNDSHLL